MTLNLRQCDPQAVSNIPQKHPNADTLIRIGKVYFRFGYTDSLITAESVAEPHRMAI